MITQNSEVYNPPYRDLFPYNEERYVGGDCILSCSDGFCNCKPKLEWAKGCFNSDTLDYLIISKGPKTLIAMYSWRQMLGLFSYVMAFIVIL